jgi:hypothetical protein
MASDKADLIRLLEAELDLIEGGGYGQPAGEATAERPMFYHSLVCINHWQVPDHDSECHDNCVLLDAVPGSHRNEKLPCHFIPLNAAGDTVQSLEQAGDRDQVQEQVKQWLRATIQRLKEGEKPLGAGEVEY